MDPPCKTKRRKALRVKGFMVFKDLSDFVGKSCVAIGRMERGKGLWRFKVGYLWRILSMFEVMRFWVLVKVSWLKVSLAMASLMHSILVLV